MGKRRRDTLSRSRSQVLISRDGLRCSPSPSRGSPQQGLCSSQTGSDSQPSSPREFTFVHVWESFPGKSNKKLYLVRPPKGTRQFHRCLVFSPPNPRNNKKLLFIKVKNNNVL